MPEENVHALDADLLRLYAILREHPAGLGEYQLLEILRGEGPVRGLDPLELFRVHFLLFHHLHRLRVSMEAADLGSLEIQCLRIRLLPCQSAPPNPARLPRAPDLLGEYYLDLENLSRTTREDVDALLSWFWRRYRVQGRQQEALEVLGLQHGADREQIQRRYRALVFLHHPDRGGDPDAFRQVIEAMEVLRLGTLSGPG